MALWNLGFRPFFLLAGAFAALSIFAWVAQFAGVLGGPALVAGPLWHAHEMIFGYAFAVVAGFLLTAVRNWANEPTPTGRTLAAMAGTWLAARLCVAASLPLPAAAADTAFAIAVAAGIGIPLVRSRNRRNYFFVALVLALGAANLCFYAAMAGAIDVAVDRGLRLGLDVVLVIMAVMGGRVIPMFTANAVPGSRPVRHPAVERFAISSVVLLPVIDLVQAPAATAAVVAGIAACAHAARLWLWQPWLTAKRPILWILHAAYGWIAVHLLLRALAGADLVPASAATHALTVGAIGGLTLGMMTRVARGHTGRPLTAGTAEVLAYWLVQFAAVARVLVPLALPQSYLAAVVVSGALWSIAFALFTATFWPVLTRPRVDGRPG
ncbi:MAG: NnrS family protein [Burkholderiales bacterium]|nr:NnrS family protein [Burkholderiales bacterium]